MSESGTGIHAKRQSLSLREWRRLGVVVLVTLLAYGLGWSPLLRVVEDRLYDARLRLLAGRHVPPEEIVIVGIDEVSLRRMEPVLGRWPWPRAAMASVIDFCSEAKVIALDVLYAEQDFSLPGSDEVFLDIVRTGSNVVNCIYLSHHPLQTVSTSALGRFVAPLPRPTMMHLPDYASVLHPFPALLDACTSLGHVNAILDGDGVCRSHMPLARSGTNAFPSLALAAASMYLRAKPDLSADGTLTLGETSLRLNAEGVFRVCPSRWTHRYYPVASIMEAWQSETDGTVNPVRREAFRGKIVLIGSTATGLMDDTHVTPLSLNTHGLEWQASSIENIRAGRTAHDLGKFTILLVLLCALVPAMPRLTNALALAGVCTATAPCV